MSQNAEVEQLETRRRQLAYEVGQGKIELEPELTHVEDELGRLRRGQERQVLAGQEAEVRAAAEATAAADAEREKRARHLDGSLKARGLCAGELDHAVDQVAKILDSLLSLDREIVGDKHALGLRQHRRAEEVITAYFAWRLGGRLPIFGPRPPMQMRKSLTELLAAPGLSLESDPDT